MTANNKANTLKDRGLTAQSKLQIHEKNWSIIQKGELTKNRLIVTNVEKGNALVIPHKNDYKRKRKKSWNIYYTKGFHDTTTR
jgi:hypothetical protein